MSVGGEKGRNECGKESVREMEGGSKNKARRNYINELMGIRGRKGKNG